MSDTLIRVKDALYYINVDVPEGANVVLSDVMSGRDGAFYCISMSQLEAAAEQYRAVTGEDLGDLSTIEAELGWY
ncbi:hypothetical protein ACT17_34270 [Mycolicibacterium conceptionense]|uniref:Uncharacterized protein n=1 Tax=Mycolicibacterium conceptionense TaxID=451644 RepID=A0A0J8TZH6_9MYCO|nr:hypothetical protein [Mycolicibacterium conceptionense]KMV13620.1 hypothetical protein ACT17_34270 [Mycolicibacterium conceptionense]